jgi:hypothetical protein
MAKSIGKLNRFSGGIADGIKEDLVPNVAAFEQSINYRSNPRQISLLPRTTKESGNVVTDFPLWLERIDVTGDSYIYGDTGNVYKRTSAGVYTLEHTVPNSTGNGIAYFGEDKYLYVASNTTLGRFGQIGIATNWYDDFLGSEGGAPTNTNSLQLLSASTQYAFRASTASLQITGNILLEAEVKPTTLPAVGSTMTLVGKWDESGATRSYIMDIQGVSGTFGDGSDGALTISADTTDAPIDSACTGTIATYALTATNASFAANQKVLIIQMQGTNAGQYEFNTIQSYTAGTITVQNALKTNYLGSGVNKAQVLVMKQYSAVTVNSGKTWTAKAWNGTVGGILTYYCNGTTTVTGSISAKSKGFRAGGSRDSGTGQPASFATVGENPTGTQPAQKESVNGGGGAGTYGNTGNLGGGGGGYGTDGTDGGHGSSPSDIYVGLKGIAFGFSDLSGLFLGTGGGGYTYGGKPPIDGTPGGGIIMPITNDLIVTGSINASANNIDFNSGQTAGGNGSGGSIRIRCLTATLGTDLVTAVGGINVNLNQYSIQGGLGGAGIIRVEYLTTLTGTTTPTMSSAVDTSLSANAGYRLRLGISSDGTATEYLTKDITTNIATGTWARWSIAWVAALSTAYFYLEGNPIGTQTGTLTSIHSNAGAFSVGANKNGAGTYTNLLNGLIDEVRVWNTNSDGSSILNRSERVLGGNEAFLQAYYKFDTSPNDSTTNANNLTLSGSPTYSVSVPFSGLTTRTDQDQVLSATGQTYTLLTAISESATDRQSFVPAKDPQKSIRVYIDTIGTGDWTLTIHDALNRVVATKTVTAANLNTGFYEFITAVWRPIIGATYHFHLTVSTGTSKIRTQTTADMETADFATFYQFLVSDTWHPMMQIVNVLAVGNERYLATHDGVSFNNQRLTFPAGTRVRCLGYWREYLAIGTWKGSSITDFDEGKIFFWDGVSDTYNFFIDVPEGGINAMKGSKGKLYIIAGPLGDLLLYQGGVEAQKLKRLPKMELTNFAEVFPGSMTVWQTLIHFGVCGDSDSPIISKGVYTWGSLNRNYAESLNFDYPISIGTVTGADIHVGMTASVGQKLLIGWRNGVNFGVDVVDPTGDCYTSGTYEALVEDMGIMEKAKLPLVLRADFEPLVTGQSVSIKFKADRESNWHSVMESTVGADNIRYRISNRVREIQPAVDLMSTSGVSPIIYNLALEEDKLAGERDV